MLVRFSPPQGGKIMAKKVSPLLGPMDDKLEKHVEKKQGPPPKVSFCELFRYANGFDYVCLVVGIIMACAAGGSQVNPAYPTTPSQLQLSILKLLYSFTYFTSS
jgi:hypothetical protein